MGHANISLFVPHIGCPHTCAFCNQRTISGEQTAPTGEDVVRICTQALAEVSDCSNTEIAFFGGSFTAIERGYMLELLESASALVGEGKFAGIRISTRPDCIDDEILLILKSYGVTAIELGAQSMCNDVLDMNERGHTVEDVQKSVQLIKSYGFEVGLQMMVGLYGSDSEKELYTMREIIACKPDTLRIYPVVVLKDTRLADLYKAGEYKLMEFGEVVHLCATMLKSFMVENIRVIRLGLHSSEAVENDMVAGFYHPAFAEIVRSEIVREVIEKYYFDECIKPDEVVEVCVSKSGVSTASGHKKSNKTYFENHSMRVKFKVDNSLDKDEICIKRNKINVFKIT